jgi:pimeloyl-ACP methyl ester carboxylesterase
MTELYFAHANGFPSKSYNCLFQHINVDKIHYINILGKGKHAINGDMNNFANEILEDIEGKKLKNIVALGHSAGAVALMIAASKKPDLFKFLFLIEPVLFSPMKRMAIDVARGVGMGEKMGVVKKARQRKMYFGDMKEAQGYFEKKKFFQRFNSQCFNDYLKEALQENSNGEVELVISANEEADIFKSVHTKVPKNLDKLHGLYIYGDNSEMLWQADIKWWKKRFPNFKMKLVAGTHVFPFENPKDTAELINEELALIKM